MPHRLSEGMVEGVSKCVEGVVGGGGVLAGVTATMCPKKCEREGVAEML